jgi:hypothetical protein
MTEEQFEEEMGNFNLDSEYAEYIMNKNDGQRIICNGDSLIEAMETGYMYNSFKDHMTKSQVI